jgi:L-amino acid N-acyltransferase
MPFDVNIRTCEEADLPHVLEIYNEAVRSTTAIWNDTAVDIENRRAWLKDRVSKSFPVLIAVSGGTIAGYASYADWRAWEGYRLTVEHSVYVRKNLHRGGVGLALMTSLIQCAREQGKHVMIGGIEATNEGSLALHAKLGFEKTAYMREVGTKFGRWLDLVFVQLILEAGVRPNAAVPR